MFIYMGLFSMCKRYTYGECLMHYMGFKIRPQIVKKGVDLYLRLCLYLECLYTKNVFS